MPHRPTHSSRGVSSGSGQRARGGPTLNSTPRGLRTLNLSVKTQPNSAGNTWAPTTLGSPTERTTAIVWAGISTSAGFWRTPNGKAMVSPGQSVRTGRSGVACVI